MTNTTPGYTIHPTSDVRDAKPRQQHRWNTLPGGNPSLEGPRRATLAEAQADAADPSRVLWRVTGYLCG